MLAPMPRRPHEALRAKLMLGIYGLLALTFMVIVVIEVLLPKIAPPPLDFKNNPSPIASNPRDPDHWDFTDPDPTFHPGDALIVEVVACVSNAVGGSVIHASGFRRLISVNGLVNDELDSTDTKVAVRPCSTSHANVGTISAATPSGRYRIEATVHGATDLYSRDSQWYTIWFEVVNP